MHLKKCAALMYAPFILREDPTGLFMESNNYQPRLVSKDIPSNIDDFSVLFEESTEYELKVGTFTLVRAQNFTEKFGLMLASFYIFNVQYQKKFDRALIFLQKFLSGIGDETKLPQKVLQLISKMK